MSDFFYESMLFLPLLGCFICGFLGCPLRWNGARFFALLCVGIAACLAGVDLFGSIFWALPSKTITLATFIDTGSLSASWGLFLDPLTRVMNFVVCFVSFLVHLYSLGYMKDDPSKARFFCYLSLFTFAMLSLVTAPNFIQLFFGWEGVGLASYLLIGFWFEKDSANQASIKAFVVNRVGDIGLILGIALIFSSFHTVDMGEFFANLGPHSPYADPAGGFLGSFTKAAHLSFLGVQVSLTQADVIGLLLFLAAMGKSAQFLLHVWLPDAMEGPTPVSALIHAATMVTAGVFLVARCAPLYELAPVARSVILLIGGTTAFMAATIALVQTDIKRVVAYSTCSQLGYMFVAMGCGGAYSIGVFHLFTHAFFKALLFLGAGSVIAATHHEQDMRKMGGLCTKLPLTWAAMVIGTLAITGFPFTAGYYSKDAIIAAAYLSKTPLHLYAFTMAVISAFLTSFYSWRLIFMTFHGPSHDHNGSSDTYAVRESPAPMIIPLVLLSLAALSAGFLCAHLFIGPSQNSFWHAIFGGGALDPERAPHLVGLTVQVLMLAGLGLAWLFYIRRPFLPALLVSHVQGFTNFLLEKWWFDRIYDTLFVRSTFFLGAFGWQKIDKGIIDKGGPSSLMSALRAGSKALSSLQTGFIHHYALAILVGLLMLMSYLMVCSPLSLVGG